MKCKGVIFKEIIAIIFMVDERDETLVFKRN